MTSKWDHLPNAKHIDNILASLNAHPEKWASVFVAYPWCRSYAGERSLAWDALYSSVDVDPYIEDVLNSALSATTIVDCNRVYRDRGACDVMLALILHDDSAHLLDSSPDEIRLLVALGHPYAVLFLAAVTAFANINALSRV